VEKPTPKAGEVLVKNEACGLNFFDTMHRSGLSHYQFPLPMIPGREGGGVVEKVGEGVLNLKVGDKVAYCTVPAAYAEYTLVPSGRAFKLPEGVDCETGASLMLQGLTAQYLVRSTFPLSAGKKALIHAGAGGLGQLLIQAAKFLGATVFTTVSSKEKEEIVKSLGADYIINYTTDDFEKKVKEFTNGKGVDVVYDSVGKDTWERSINSLSPLGYLVLLGSASGEVPPIDPQLLREKGSLFLTRTNLANYVIEDETYQRRCVELFEWVTSGKLKLSPPTKFPLSEMAKAHELLESRKTVGKVLLIPQHKN